MPLATRLAYFQLAPALLQNLIDLSSSVKKSSLDSRLLELIFITAPASRQVLN